MCPAPGQGQRLSLCLSARDEAVQVRCSAGKGAPRRDSPALCHSVRSWVRTMGCAALTLCVIAESQMALGWETP